MTTKTGFVPLFTAIHLRQLAEVDCIIEKKKPCVGYIASSIF